MKNENEIVLFESKDGNVTLPVSVDVDTVWLSRKQMAELFDKDRTVIGRHIKNAIDEGEINPTTMCAKYAHMGKYDVIKAFTSYILEGAALAKRVGSPAYDKWGDALVMLTDEYNGSKNYKSVDLVAEAYARTWGDVHAWIHINGYDKFKKTNKKGKNKRNKIAKSKYETFSWLDLLSLAMRSGRILGAYFAQASRD